MFEQGIKREGTRTPAPRLRKNKQNKRKKVKKDDDRKLAGGGRAGKGRLRLRGGADGGFSSRCCR